MVRPRRSHLIPHASAMPQRQLNIAFDATALRGLTPIERANVLEHLATLLLQAAGSPMGAHDDDEQ